MKEKLIVLTEPEFFEGEATLLNKLFEAGLTRLHIRKPESKREEVVKLITELDISVRKYITLHYHPGLVAEMGLGGMHLSYPQLLANKHLSTTYTTSCSLHQWEELKEVREKIHYCFMSPVFNSISKHGYVANKALKEVPSYVKNTYALGGIALENCDEVLSNGYTGVAVLGYLWENRQYTLQRFDRLQQKLKIYDL